MRQAVHSTLLFFIAVAMNAGAAEIPGLRGGVPRFLPVDEAFQLTATRKDGQVEVRWFVMPGYYLYRKSLSFRAPGDGQQGEEFQPHIPDGVPRHDEYFGDVEVYHDELLVELDVEGDLLEVRYQGCAEAGYCYPPQKKRLNVVKMQTSTE